MTSVEGLSKISLRIFKVNSIVSILTILLSNSFRCDLECLGCRTARKDRRGSPENLKKAKLKKRYNSKCIRNKYYILLSSELDSPVNSTHKITPTLLSFQCEYCVTYQYFLVQNW